MTLQGETNGLHGTTCPACKARLALRVCSSNAGWYLGYWCGECGPVSRETGHYASVYIAETQLDRVRAGREPWKVRG
jgi:hypothetical protein